MLRVYKIKSILSIMNKLKFTKKIKNNIIFLSLKKITLIQIDY